MDKTIEDWQSYYDEEADIAWLAIKHDNDPLIKAFDIVSEEYGGGVYDYDKETGKIVGIEIWSASEKFSPSLLKKLPRAGDL